ncbi:MAG TPA: hypothetical protein PKK10_11215 [Woeseiaceae bacterium]|nr:hypothetical protein [Woeseiaceae bacterium]
MSQKSEINDTQLRELLYQALETELGGEQVYKQALKCVINEDLQEEWEAYLEETRTHQKILRNVFEKLGLDSTVQSTGRDVVHHIGKSLVDSMRIALESGGRAAAELVAAECVVLAETKDHLNWELIGHVAEAARGDTARILKSAHDEIEDQEDHHLYHTRGFLRELWLDALGLPAVLPPPEEVKNVKTAIGASRAEHAREQLM